MKLQRIENFMIAKLAHRILENELAYDVFQTCVGSYKFRERYLESIEIEPDSKILELGCGTGISLNTIRDNEYVGIDLSMRYLEKASRRRDAVQLVNGDVSMSDSYHGINAKKDDVVLALALWHHLDDEQMHQTLRNIYQISEDGVSVYSLDPFFDEKTSISAKWVAMNDRGKNLRSSEHLKEISEAAGFHFSYQISRRELYIPTNVIMCKLVK